jgi:DNA-binding MarR family transcriptional regulator
MKIVVKGKEIKVTTQQERFLKLLYKFRYVNATELAKVLSMRSDNTYKVLEALKTKGLVAKVYKKEYRIDRKPAYYYLSNTGVTTVRKLLNVPESVVHALYKQGSDDFIAQCQTTLACYNLLRDQLPAETYIFAKTEINQDTAFPKNRPDL